ncbi:DMT family transporter [Alcaligenaceae bacterium]|nr:DMT family transporter [Alcaligenaceae bacterium]
MTLLEWGMLFALACLWGGSFFFNGVAVQELPVLTIVASRVALAAIILMVIARLRGDVLRHNPKVWAAFFGLGLLNNVIPFSLIVWGQQHIASGVAAILNAATPLFTVIFAHFLTSDERITKGKLLGVLIGFIGVAVMIGTEALRDLGVNVVAQFLCLAGAVSYAFAGIYGRRFRALGITPMSTATGQVIASSIILLPLAVIVDRPWLLPTPSWAVIGALLGAAALSTALAYVLFFRILASAGVTNVSLVTFLVPVSAIFLGTLILGEVLYARHFSGMALIGVGLAAIDGRPAQALRNAFSESAN